MSASATIAKQYKFQGVSGAVFNMARLDISGLSVGPNVIPHGMGGAVGAPESILREEVLLTSTIQVHQTQPGDYWNLYYTVDAGPGTTISVWVTVWGG
jgi:hypothetical protein